MDNIKAMQKNEIRVFRISDNAINELMWELLNKCGEMLLDLPDNTEAVFRMNWDKTKDELVFYALEFENPHKVNFDSIDRTIKDNVECVSNSLFIPGITPYKTLIIEDDTT